ncbi:selenium cofactor biosynthesis protein YqeC [Clostridium intestinale]|uniref:selenium cofactor biosynthesis protein YqeC n=1 Tax=Clostridium intestinale TaxID=36845 RepID=UPI0028E230C0|nr:selenium cofactor biosynthesis protein YqeC [Clostridium intestinale]
MKLKDALDVRLGDVITIVGAGGKTTLMFTLGEELRGEGKVLITTTTKIYMPETHQFDFLEIDFHKFNRNVINKGIYIYGESVDSENKIKGLSLKLLEKQLHKFDYVLVEGDGSKKKPLKGWREDEPVVSSNTTRTVGVLSIEVVGKKINEGNIHRVDRFLDITNSNLGEVIDLEMITSLVFHEKGLFKDTKGEKILFINKVESYKDKMLAECLKEKIKKINNGYIDKIICGSLRGEVDD